MAASGMVGWGLGLKVTPQGTFYASMMTYDAYDNLENVMKHLSGGAAISVLQQNKLKPIQWSMRPVMGATTPTLNINFKSLWAALEAFNSFTHQNEASF